MNKFENLLDSGNFFPLMLNVISKYLPASPNVGRSYCVKNWVLGLISWLQLSPFFCASCVKSEECLVL